MPRSFRAASPLKRVSLLLLVLPVIGGTPRSRERHFAIAHRSLAQRSRNQSPYDPTRSMSRWGLASLWLVLLRAPPGARLLDRHYAGAGQSKAYASTLDSIKSICWIEYGSTALQDCPRREQMRLRREQLSWPGAAYAVGRKETWALTTRHPSGMRTQVWLCRPRGPDSVRWNSVFAVARSRPKVVITVRMMARVMSVRERASREAWIASNP